MKYFLPLLCILLLGGFAILAALRGENFIAISLCLFTLPYGALAIREVIIELPPQQKV